MKKRTRVFAALFWALIVFYPNPAMLFVTLWHSLSPPIDASAAKELAASLPDDPNIIRDRVLSDIVPYEYDWAIYDVPWYFPSTKEVVRDRRGDCESQAVMLASIFEAKGIPYQLKISFDHIWVDFWLKPEADMEHDEMALIERDGDTIEIKVPKHFDLKQYIEIQLDARWHPMPVQRKVLLFAGLLLIAAGPMMLQRRRLPEVARGANP